MLFLMPLALLVTSALAALHIDNPQNVTQCNLVSVSWHDFTAPVDVYYLGEGSNPASGVVVSNYSEAGVAWKVVVPPGQLLRLAIFDAGQQFASTDAFRVQDSHDNSCLASAT